MKNISHHLSRTAILVALLLAVLLCLPASCADDDIPASANAHTEKTLFIYMPWTIDLTTYFEQNLRDIEACIRNMGGLRNERVLVFFSENAAEASLFEIQYKGGQCRRINLKKYVRPELTTESGIAGILEDVADIAPAEKYAMVIGCHGLAWIPVSAGRAMLSAGKKIRDGDGGVLTRFFGAANNPEFQTDIATLASAIADAGLHMEYILFDDCYMASVEVAYELKDVADYLIASTCEVMAYGMPYETMGRHLLGKTDYKAVCADFYSFYSAYSMPYGTLSVTDMAHLDDMAAFMKYVNATYTFDSSQRARLQALDGYSPTLFYDFGDYVDQLLAQNNAPEALKKEFEVRLSRLIPHKTNTESYFTNNRGAMKLERYSGITVSDPSINALAAGKNRTRWYEATH